MISWLQGHRLDNWQLSQRQGIVLACSGVGYEIQLLPRHLALIGLAKELTLWIHQVKRDDGENLYGFETQKERDLFRILIGVNGVGPQMAIALLEDSQVEQLVSAIIHEDIRKLSQAQGIGKRTAERLSIELRNKLAEFDCYDHRKEIRPLNNKELPLGGSDINELQKSLKSLGYEDLEISKVIRAVATEEKQADIPNDPDMTTSFDNLEALLKQCLLWLSNESKL